MHFFFKAPQLILIWEMLKNQGLGALSLIYFQIYDYVTAKYELSTCGFYALDSMLSHGISTSKLLHGTHNLKTPFSW